VYLHQSPQTARVLETIKN